MIISYLIVEVRSDADSAIDEEALLLNCRECNSRSSLYFLRSPDELHEEEVIRIIFLGNLEDYFVLIPLLVDIHVFTFETLQGNCSEFIFRVINLYSTLNVSSWNFLSCTVLNSITFVGLNSESIVLVSIPNVPFFLIVSCQLLIKCLERELQITNCIIRITVVSNCIISIEFSQNDSLEVNLYLEVTDRSNIVILVEQSHANNTNLTNVGIRSTFYNLSLNDTSVLVDSESFSRLIVLAILNKSVLIVEASFLQLTVRSSIFVKKLPLMSILVCTIIAIRTDILSKFKLFTSVCNLESQTSVTICLGTRSSQERKCKIVFLMCFISIYGLTNLQSLIIIINNTSVVRRNHTCRLTFTCSWCDIRKRNNIDWILAIVFKTRIEGNLQNTILIFRCSKNFYRSFCFSTTRTICRTQSIESEILLIENNLCIWRIHIILSFCVSKSTFTSCISFFRKVYNTIRICLLNFISQESENIVFNSFNTIEVSSRTQLKRSNLSSLKHIQTLRKLFLLEFFNCSIDSSFNLLICLIVSFLKFLYFFLKRVYTSSIASSTLSFESSNTLLVIFKSLLLIIYLRRKSRNLIKFSRSQESGSLWTDSIELSLQSLNIASISINKFLCFIELSKLHWHSRSVCDSLVKIFLSSFKFLLCSKSSKLTFCISSFFVSSFQRTTKSNDFFIDFSLCSSQIIKAIIHLLEILIVILTRNERARRSCDQQPEQCGIHKILFHYVMNWFILMISLSIWPTYAGVTLYWENWWISAKLG